MIVLLNTSNKTITICDKTVKVYPWSKIKEISGILDGKEILYVSEILSVTGDEVIDLINESIGEENIGDQTSILETEFYIHTKTKSKIMATYNGKDYLFKGCYDLRPINSLPEGMLEKCYIIVEGLKNGLLEIVGESEKNFLMQKYEEESIEAKDSLNRLEESIKGSVDDPIEINLSPSGNFKKGKN